MPTNGADRRRQLHSPTALDWKRDGPDWPNRNASRFVEAGRLRWHVQLAGSGPALLLVHGTGASTHSWRDLLPRLAERFTVVAPDLPGHAFTQSPGSERRMSLPAMASGIGDLLRCLEIEPQIVIGHSAGAAIVSRLCLDRVISPAGLIALNGAMLPIGGLAGQIFSPLAKVLSSTTLAARLFARWAGDQDVVERVIDQTGSRLDAVGLALYGRLARDPNHAAGALAMMANWQLEPLVRHLRSLRQPLVLVVGSKDRSIDPANAFRVRNLVPDAAIEMLSGLGHLAHEEAPDTIADIIERYAAAWSVGGA